MATSDVATPPAAAPHERGFPRDRDNNYTDEIAAKRRHFIQRQTGAELEHVGAYSFDPGILPGNVENFFGVAQVPIGLAGPLLIKGEHARGEFYIPMATTEGTVVASYNRGMHLLSATGGITATVVDDCMQRAPVFMLDSALEAREFGKWIDANLETIAAKAEASTKIGRLRNIDQFSVGPLLYLRFNYTTGDAAGQNMTGRCTFYACEWIKKTFPGTCDYFLTGNTDTDKKHSQMNVLMTRGKRVVAEAVIRKELIQKYLHIDTVDLARMREVQMTGAFLAGSSSNCAHPANGLSALFIATGQDVANIAESHAALTYTQFLDTGDFYWSVTLPSLIVGTYGGGTGLATQRECLEMLGCFGEGKVYKFAEICAAVVLAGELSLIAAILHGDWVTSHEKMGRNRP